MVKKIITMLILLLMMSSVGYGVVSEDMSVYVRKDVFDAKMEALFNRLHGDIMALSERMEGNFAKLSERIDGVNASLSGRIDGVNTSLSGRIDGLDKRIDSLDKRIDDLRNGIYLWLVAIGLLIAWPKLFEKFQNWGKSKPSITLEDVKRLIEEQLEKNNAELRKSIQL